MSISPSDIIDINALTAQGLDNYKNFALTHVNDHVIRMSIMTEDYYWHYHPNSDETFLVAEGTLLLDLKSETLELSKGQMITVPKNVPHRTRPKGGPSVNLTIELKDMETVRLED
jgi:mannose-6-phosphate isomerase-like protein (cupin superfamily)